MDKIDLLVIKVVLYKTNKTKDVKMAEQALGIPLPQTQQPFTHPLSNVEIFDRVRPLMCSVASANGESSGFLFKTGVMVTVMHNVSRGQLDSVQVISHQQKESPFFPEVVSNINLDRAQMIDLCTFVQSVELKEGEEYLPLLPESVPLKEGMEVYFAGFPLGHDQITFHKGMISSIIAHKGYQEFTIDGTIVPGNSGGPVILLHENRPYLVGMITSEVADLNPEDIRTMQIFQAFSEVSPPKLDVTDRDIGCSIIQSPKGYGIVVGMTTQGRTENIVLYHSDASIFALELFRRNLSTGIGRALDLRCHSCLSNNQPLNRLGGTAYFPTGKGKKPVQGKYPSTGQEILKYIEVRYGGNGPGNRGIRVTMVDGAGSYSYKFSPNPHKAPGNYNKNREELYSEAAKAIGMFYQANDRTRSPFDFGACQHTYTATRES